MAIRIYDTLTRQLQELPLPAQQPELKMYVCGPTVYDDPHIGHARSAYVFDVIRRYLEYRGYKVTFVRNVTDVDDKIIAKASQEKRTTEQVAGHYLETYHAAMSQLGLLPPTKEPKATEHIPQMQQLIKALVRKGSAYVAANGDVYFAVRAFNGYGKLSNRSVDELESGARVEPGEEKRDPLDFALWKAAKPGEPQWSDQTPDEQPALVPGRPGWHIECSAMSMQYLGETFDIHGGGVDLVFPHHENEVAQSQAFTGNPHSFAKYWIHNGLLTINGQKMSKSLGNFVTIDQALGKLRQRLDRDAFGDETNALKLFFLGAHYRSPMDYSDSNMDAAVKSLIGLRPIEDIHSFRMQLEDYYSSIPPVTPKSSIGELDVHRQEFEGAMDNDFNTPQALAVLHKLIKVMYKCSEEKYSMQIKVVGSPPLSDEEIRQVQGLLRRYLEAADLLSELGGVLGLQLRENLVKPSSDQNSLLQKREEFRKQKKFAEADKIRKQFDEMGLVVEDTSHGPVIRRKVGR